jgi:hypothetical protein
MDEDETMSTIETTPNFKHTYLVTKNQFFFNEWTTWKNGIGS